jgi:succinate dehydrogenase hydrophobic membrane anchor protein
MQRQVEKRPAGTWLWQAVTGVLVVLLLGLHMVAQHFVATNGLRSYEEVLAYFRNPIVVVLEVLFLAVVTYHALLGLRAIVADLSPTKGVRDTVNTVLTVVGVLAVLYGLYLSYYLLTKA